MKYLNVANSVTSDSRSECVMTLIDLSPSMDDDDWNPSRKTGAIKANIELIKAKARCHPSDMIGIIGFAGATRVLHDLVCLSGGIKSLQKALKNPSGCRGGTNFTAALELAQEHLLGRKTKHTSNFISRMLAELLYEEDTPVTRRTKQHQNNGKELKRIILLTDGEHNQGGPPIKLASDLKNAGVVIDCIGIGGSHQDVDEKLLKQIASRNSDGSIRYCFIGNQQQLLRKYETLAHHIRPV